MLQKNQLPPVWRSLAASGLAVTVLLAASCGGGMSGATEGNSSPPPPPPDIPSLSTIAPTGAIAGSMAVGLTLLGSNFESGASVLWNGTPLSSSRVSATEMTATVPMGDLISAGTAQVTVVNPSPGGGTSPGQVFTILAIPPASAWVRPIVGVSTPQDLVWDSVHGLLYVSIASTDSVAPNTIIPVNPVTAAAEAPVPAGNNPDLLSISSDSSYLWAGLDGANSVQRFVLPGLTKDIALSLPLDPGGRPQQAVSLEAAPGGPHTVAVVAGHVSDSPPGDGVYIYDDATPRPTSVLGFENGGAELDWLQWGGSSSVLYGTSLSSPGPIATLNVTAAGVSWTGSNGGGNGASYTQYDSSNGFLYSTSSSYFGTTWNPVNGSQAGRFDLPGGAEDACTADPSLGRYYCVITSYQYELWVFDMSTYTLLNRVLLGTNESRSTSPITGQPWRLVRWGNAGLALITLAAVYEGNSGLFLIDGAAINPSSIGDFSSGTAGPAYSWMGSLAPSQVQAGTGNVNVTVTGSGFTPDSVACLLCNGVQNQYLPTTYVSAQELSATVPASALAAARTVPISIFDYATSLGSTNSLTITVVPVPSGSTRVTAVNLAGLAMDWDANSGLLYVGTADYDGTYPNSIVAVSGETGAVVKHQTVGADPDLVAVSANGQYLYAGFFNATTETQLQLPSLGSQLTWTLNNPEGTQVYWAGDLRASPANPDLTAVDLVELPWGIVSESGGVAIYDDNMLDPDFVRGWGPGPGNPGIYDAIAWGASDQILTAACNLGCLNTPVSPLYEFQVTQLGASFVAAGAPTFSEGQIHSDFGTGLIYSDDGNVGDPNTQSVVGSYNASGLVAPDSTLNRVFTLGQTAAQANTNNFTIESFDEKGYAAVSSITLPNILGSPFQLLRWGSSGLAVLTINTPINTGLGSPGMLYLIQDTTFVSSAQNTASSLSQQHELVQQRWKRISRADVVNMLRAKSPAP